MDTENDIKNVGGYDFSKIANINCIVIPVADSPLYALRNRLQKYLRRNRFRRTF
jgi:hypothetical protein